MDLHKRIAADVKSKKDRDRAAEFLRTLYGKAIQGTEWETLWNELDQAADPIDATEVIELYEVEDRGVGVAWPDEGMGFAWVWSNGWREAAVSVGFYSAVSVSQSGGPRGPGGNGDRGGFAADPLTFSHWRERGKSYSGLLYGSTK